MTGGQHSPVSSPPKSRSAWLSWPAWTGVGSLAAVLALGVALAAWWYPQSAESSTPSAASRSGSGSAAPGSGSATTSASASAAGSVPADGAGSAPASGLASAAADVEQADAPVQAAGDPATAAAGQRKYLFQLPANSAGQPGQQRTPLDVTLAGNRYQRSTGMWTSCSGKPAPTVSFWTGGTYQHLAGTLGLVDSAPAGLSVTVYFYGDDGQADYFTINHGQTVPIDLDISSFEKVGFSSLTVDGCPRTGKPLVHLGDAVVF